MDAQSTVYVVDDDLDSRTVLISIVQSMRLRSVPCTNADEFLATCDDSSPCCLVTDLRMRGMSGLDLLRHLRASGHTIPTVIVTGYAETAIAVDAMHAGAVTFLEKTVPQHKICDAISQALRLSIQFLQQKAERERIIRICTSFHPEEREVLNLVAQGKLNKEIAFEIGAPLRTIEDRRRRLMNKIGAESMAELIRFAVRVEELEESTSPDTNFRNRYW